MGHFLWFWVLKELQIIFVKSLAFEQEIANNVSALKETFWCSDPSCLYGIVFHPPPDCRGKRCCFLYAGCLAPVPYEVNSWFFKDITYSMEICTGVAFSTTGSTPVAFPQKFGLSNWLRDYTDANTYRLHLYDPWTPDHSLTVLCLWLVIKRVYGL